MNAQRASLPFLAVGGTSNVTLAYHSGSSCGPDCGRIDMTGVSVSFIAWDALKKPTNSITDCYVHYALVAGDGIGAPLLLSGQAPILCDGTPTQLGPMVDSWALAHAFERYVNESTLDEICQATNDHGTSATLPVNALAWAYGDWHDTSPHTADDLLDRVRIGSLNVTLVCEP